MTSDQKIRLDLLLVSRGYFQTRETAKRAVMAGLVTSRGEVLDKPGTLVRVSIDLQVQAPEHNFVSRGGVKLEHALTTFGFDMSNQVVLDVGASTGGFTDCALQHGARFVHAVDVGYGQFAWKLRNDPRVHLLERTNFRHVDGSVFQPKPDVAVMDVSFISIRLLFPKLREALRDEGTIITLVKPQFEAGRANVGKGGIVRDPNVHFRVLLDVITAAVACGMQCRAITFSPVEGGDGNIEFLLWLDLQGIPTGPEAWFRDARETVVEAWRVLKRTDIDLDVGKE